MRFFPFICEFCKKSFGKNVLKLGKHIGEEHDPTREKHD